MKYEYDSLHITKYCKTLPEQPAQNTFEIDFSQWYTIANVPLQIPAFDITKAYAKFEVATSDRLRGDAFTREYIISLMSLTLGREQTRKVAQYPLHHMTYAPAKFEASMSNGLGVNAFTRTTLFDLDPRFDIATFHG